MRDVNDDMDNLFRRAADNYPLNTNSSDWNKLQSAMQASANPEGQKRDKKKYRRFLWLLLLLPLAFMINRYAFHKPENGTAKLDQSLPEQKVVSPEKISDGTSNKEIDSEPASTKTENQAKNHLPTKTSQIKISDALVNQVNKKTNRNQNSFKQNITYNKEVITEDIAEKMQRDFAQRDQKVNIEDENKNPETKEDKETDENNIKESIKVEPNDENKLVTTGDTQTGKDIAKAQKNDVTKPHTQIALKKSRPPSFYVGIVAGPDLSTVKLEKIIKTGFTLGVIAGYRFNKNLSIESGLLFDKKYYYSEGKYFNTKNLNVPYWLKIDDVDGYCNMTELPLNVKYDFKSTKKINWFVVTGISSYFMKKESYSYRYWTYGQQKEDNLTRKDASQIWASVMNLGAGLSRNLGKTGVLRIEPYVKIPFKGVGIGNLPITSSGVYLSFTKNLF
jgi:hypothetical protein